MSYVILEANGKQFWVEPKKFYDLTYTYLNPGDAISLSRILLVHNNGNLMIGQPCLERLSVPAIVLGHTRSRKITIYKMRPKKKTRKKQGHRNNLTRVLVNSITV
jgi:large subunit ribosomal protein L21